MPDEATTHDAAAGASSWVDVKNRMFWTWTSPKDIEQSCADHMQDVGGVMVWSINQDENGATGGPHMDAIAGCLGGAAAGGNKTTPATPSNQTSVNAGANSNAGAPVASD
jgi:GH18 family chitinase